MTETRLKELQTEIARLEALDTQITNSVNDEFESQIVVPCSLDLDLEFARESE
jgi:hypothetical protein|tara:strand:+ start:309 stop:467 length:159 start_codon:yes stop_codon:yes gene_type:complete